MKVVLIVILLITLCASTAFAMKQEGCGGECSSCHNLSLKEANQLLTGVGEVKEVKLSTVRGLFEVALENGDRKATAYVDFGKKFLITGPIFNIATKTPIKEIPREEQKKKEVTKVDSNSIPLTNALLMGNPNGKKRLFVFTDPECPFCKKMHEQLKILLEKDHDLAIYIKLYPLKMHPKAFDKARVILGRNSLELLEKSFKGETLPEPGPQDSKDIVEESIKFAESIGVNATPTLVFPDGRVIAGFMDAEKLGKMFGN